MADATKGTFRRFMEDPLFQRQVEEVVRRALLTDTVAYINGSSTPLTPDLMRGGLVNWENGGAAGTYTVNAPVAQYPGQRWTLFYYNSSVNSHTLAFQTSAFVMPGGSSLTVASNNRATVSFFWSPNFNAWVAEGAPMSTGLST